LKIPADRKIVQLIAKRYKSPSYINEFYSQTYDYLRSLAEEHPQHVELYVGGSSHEGRDILGVKLSYKEGNPKIFVESGELLTSCKQTFVTFIFDYSDDLRLLKP
jgi:hypothetical protein